MSEVWTVGSSMYLFFLWTFHVVLIQRPSLKDTQGLLRKENSPVDCF